MYRARFKGRVIPYLFLAPTLAILIIFLYYPIFQTFRLSLYRVAFLGLKKTFVGFANFTFLFHNPDYLHSILVTVVVTSAIVVGGLGISLAISLLANQKVRGARVYRLLLIWPYALSPAIAGIIWLFLFSPGYGIVNYLLSLTVHIAPNWLGDPYLAVLIIIVASIWKNLGYNVAFYLAALQNLNTDVLEAASIDGAGAWRRFWAVTFPLLSPMTFFLLVTNITYAFFDIFPIVDVMTKGGPFNATNILIYNLYREGFEYYRTGSAAAQSLILFAGVVILTLVQFRTSGRHVHYGGA